MDKRLDRTSDVYLGKHGEPAFKAHHRDRIHWICRHVQGQRILDIGSSQGIVSILLGREGFDAVGVEIEPELVRQANEALAKEPDFVRQRVKFILGDILSAALELGSFDTVIVGEVVEHLVHPKGLLERCEQLLKDGGIIVLTTPFGAHPFHDHKATYYAARVRRLLPESFHLEDLHLVNTFVGPWSPAPTLCLTARKSKAIPQEASRRESELLRLLDFDEDSFEAAERRYLAMAEYREEQRAVLGKQLEETRDRLKRAEEELHRTQEQLNAEVVSLQRERDEKIANLQTQTQAETASLRTETASLQRQLEAASFEAYSLRRSVSFRLGHLLLRIARLPYDLPVRILRGRTLPASPAAPGPPAAAAADAPALVLEPKSESKIGLPPKVNIPEGPVARPHITAAAVMDDLFHECYRYELNLVRVTPHNWRETLSGKKVDFLFVESAWFGPQSAWKDMIHQADAPKAQPLVELVRWCKEQKIPTVFWTREDPPHYEKFLPAARLFDHVFTTDADCIPRYRRDLGHDRVQALPFAAQPRIHNPIALSSGRVHHLAFAGSWVGFQHPNRRVQARIILEPALELGLHIWDRNLYRPWGRKGWEFPEQYENSIVGYLDYEDMLAAYKWYKVFLNVNSVANSSTTMANRVLELLACGTPVVSGYSQGIANLLGEDIVPMPRTPEELRATVGRLLGDEELRDRLSLVGQRKVFSEHTYGHRVDTILEALGLEKPKPAPLASVLTATIRPEQLDNIIQNFTGQVYPNKELILIATGYPMGESALEDRLRKAGISQFKVLFKDRSFTWGACLNAGVDASRGEFIAIMDDDDFYGEYFLTDLLHAFSYSDADIVGKRSYYTLVEGQDCLALRFPGEEYQYVDLVSGATMVLRRSVFERIRVPDVRVGRDTEFLRACVATGMKLFSADRFNFTLVRRADVSRHHWQADEAEILSKSRVVGYGLRQDYAMVSEPPLLFARPSTGAKRTAVGVRSAPASEASTAPAQVRRPDVRVAAILDEFSHAGLRYECDLVTLTPRDAIAQLSAAPPALFFMENVWAGVHEEWRGKVTTPSGEVQPEIVEIINWCRKNGVPTAFWHKELAEDFSRFKALAALFDFVFVADQAMTRQYEDLVGRGQVQPLLFAVQPRLQNPEPSPRGRRYAVAFAGSWYHDKFPDRVRQIEIVLAPAIDFGLHIFDRYLHRPEAHYRWPEPYERCVVGRLPYTEMSAAYKEYKIFLNVSSVPDASTLFPRRVAELMACGTPVISGESAPLRRIFGDETIRFTASPEQTRAHLRELLEDSTARIALATRGCQQVMAAHTWSHRFEEIVAALGLPQGSKAVEPPYTAEEIARLVRASHESGWSAMPRRRSQPGGTAPHGAPQRAAGPAMADPAEDEREGAEAFWAAYPLKEFYFTGEESVRRSRWLAQEVLSRYEFASVLEPGCNCGRNLHYLLKHYPAIEAAGFDINEQAIAFAREHVPGATFEVRSVHDTAGIPDNRYDIIFTMSLLDHVPEVEQVCREFLRIARQAVILIEVDTGAEGKCVEELKQTGVDNYCYSRNYRRLFESLGARVRRYEAVPQQFPDVFMGRHYWLLEVAVGD